MRAMMMMATAGLAIGLAGTAIGLAGTAQAQEVVHWSAPPAAVHGDYSYFPMGTPLRLATRTELSSRDNHAGDRFYLEVAEPLVYRGQVVVPVGSLAVGEVMRAEHNGSLGKRGEMAVRLLYVQTPSGPVRLSGRTDRAGKGQRLLAIGGAAVIAWPMIFIHGTSARLPAETAVTAFLADDLRFPVAGASQPMALATDASTMPAARMLPARFDPAAFGGRP